MKIVLFFSKFFLTMWNLCLTLPNKRTIKKNKEQMKNYTDLNSNEVEVLKAISIASQSTGGDFTYFDEVMPHLKSLTESQVKGYVSQLSQKGYIWVQKEAKYPQIISGEYVDFLTDYKF